MAERLDTMSNVVRRVLIAAWGVLCVYPQWRLVIQRNSLSVKDYIYIYIYNLGRLEWDCERRKNLKSVWFWESIEKCNVRPKANATFRVLIANMINKLDRSAAKKQQSCSFVESNSWFMVLDLIAVWNIASDVVLSETMNSNDLSLYTVSAHKEW